MRSTGSITEFRGKWRIRLMIDGKRKSMGLHSTRRDAERVLAAALKQLNERNGGLKRGRTLRSWGETWLEERELDGLHRSVHKDRTRWKSRILSQAWADEPVRTITTRDVVSWVRDMVKEGCRRTTITNALNLLRVCLEEAVAANIITTNVARGVRVPRLPRTDDTWRVLSAEDVIRITTSPLLSDRERIIFALAVYTGLRPGELWGLRWNDVHLKGEQPHLVVRYSRDLPTKTGLVREVPLLPPARDALKDWQKTLPGTGAAVVFPSPDRRFYAANYDGGWRRARKLLELTKYRFYDLRHTCASHLVRGTWGRTWSLEEVRQWLGHTSIATTERYAHFAPGNLHDAAREMRSIGHFGDTEKARSGARRND